MISVWGAGPVGMHLAPRGDAHDMGDQRSGRRPSATWRANSASASIAFLCAREVAGERRGSGPQLKAAFGGVYIANEGFHQR